MELAQLRALRELDVRGSIAAVAAAMRVTPSSISQQLSALQRGLDVPLTERIGRRTALTPAGKALAEAVADVEVALERARQAVTRFQAEPEAEVTVAAFASAALAVFGPLLHNSERISVSDHDVRQDAFPALTLTHDLVIAHRLQNSPPWPGTVAVVPLMVEPLDLAMRAGHPLTRHRAVGADLLRGVAWVAVHDGFPLQGAVETLSNLAAIEADVRHRVNDFFVAAAVVAQTDCVALLPRYLTAAMPRSGIELRPTEEFSVSRHIDVLARPETLQRRSVQTVLAEVRGLFEGFRSEERRPGAHPGHRD